MNPYRIGAHVKRRKCDGLAYPEQSSVRIVSHRAVVATGHLRIADGHA